jgi:hypothetical protein
MASVAAAIETVPQAIRRSLSFTLKSVRPLYPVCVNVDDAPRWHRRPGTQPCQGREWEPRTWSTGPRAR